MTLQQQQLTFCPITAPNGTRLCAVDGPTQLPFIVDKLTSCALATMRSNFAVFNYNLTKNQCSVYQSSPWSWSQEHVNDCVSYEVHTTHWLIYATNVTFQ